MIVPSTLLNNQTEISLHIYHSTSLLNNGLELNGLPLPMVKPLVPSGILGLFEVSLEDASHKTWPLVCGDDVTGKL